MTLQQNTDHIQTTHIGSLPRPHNLLDLLKASIRVSPITRASWSQCWRSRSPNVSGDRSNASLSLAH